MNTIKSHLNHLGLLACALLLGTCFRVQAADTTTVSLRATDPTALEGTTTGAFTLIRTGDTNDALSVDVDISGTAVSGVDYTPISSTLVIPAGFYAVDVTVQPVLDTVTRGNKTVVLTVQSNAAYVISHAKGTVKIVDDVFDIPPPSVSITNPADGAVFTAPATVTVTAEVSDPTLPIVSISFYANDTFLGSVTNSPYTIVTTNLLAGHHALFARALDAYGKSGVSDTVDITVSAGPVVTLTSPDGNEVNEGEVLPLDAEIGDPNEAISSVSFYNGSKLLGTVTSAPFEFNWQTTKTGTFELHAVATDKNTGKTGTSPVFQVLVIAGGGS